MKTLSRAICCLIVCSSAAWAQDPSEDRFVLGFQGPDSITGAPGSLQNAQYFCTLTHEGVGPGATAWSFGGGVTTADGSPALIAPLNIGVAGTDAGGLLLADGFQHHEVTPGGGFIGAVILSSTVELTLPPNATSTIAVVDVVATIPPPSLNPPTNTLTYTDGVQGSGRPVSLVVTQEHVLHEPDVDPLDVLLIPEAPFLRGDTDDDGRLTINDAVLGFWHIVLGRPQIHPCPDAVDANDDGILNVTDMTNLLGDLFQGTFVIPPPVVCGFDPTPDGLGCALYNSCGPAIQLATTLPAGVFVVGDQVPLQAQVSTDGPFAGTLRVTAYAAQGEDQGATVDVQSFAVSHPAAALSNFDVFVNTTIPAHHYFVSQVLSPDELVLAEEVRDVGVRGADPRLQALPDSILAAQVEVVDVAGLQEQVEAMADTGAPVDIALGGRDLQVVLRRSSILEPDAELDELVVDVIPSIQSFNGQVLDPNGEVIPGSTAVLSFGLGTVYGLFAQDSESALWAEPLNNYDGQSPMNTIVSYLAQDVTPSENDHVEPVADDLRVGQDEVPLNLDLPEGAGANFAFFDINKTIRLKVYEHYISSSRTLRRCNLIYSWRALMINEFQNVHPRVTSIIHLDVVNVTIQSWGTLSTSGYGGSCNADLSRFRSQRSGVNHRLYVLFSHLPTGCGGIAYLGQGSRTDWHSITKDTHSYHTDVVILGQETGHNLDWHGTWAGPPHDAHVGVSEQWNVIHCTPGCWIHQHCTIMRASYTGCDFAEWRYRRFSNTGLRHIAEGILRTF